MCLYIFLTIFLLIITHIIWKVRNLPPGPWGLPIVGYLPWLNPKAPHLTLTDLSKKYGSIYSLSLGNVTTVVLTDPKQIKTLFTKDATIGRAPLYVTHGIMHGYGLICAEGALWKDQRRFVHNCLRNMGGSKTGPRKNMEQLIIKHLNEFVKYIKGLDRNQPIDPLEPLRHSIGSFINEIVFGRYWDKDDETWVWLQHLQEEGVKHIGVAGPLNFLPFLRFLPMFKRTLSFLTEGVGKTHRIYQKLIDEEYALLNKSRSEDLDTNNYTNLMQGFLIEREKRRDTNDAGLRYYTDEQLHYLLADMFGAGLDTTLTTLRWFLLYMAKNENTQTQFRIELNTVLNGRFPSIDDISSMPFVEACIAETQRIRPVVPLGMPHGALEDIEINNYIIPKGSMIVALQWAVHQNEEQYHDPEVFNPNNFINDEGKFYKPDHFIPFQNGKRMCVGDELARMILFFSSAIILQSFKLKLGDKDNVSMEGEAGITLTPKSYKLYFLDSEMN
ncbi:cytochrome P450 306a1 [Sitophilus oryzae]|uniref:Cytochrome P450 306a1 n=1 Tax=Sitophilus oryzae TaxID=7048 RepID=A0A6J2X634_SITOR|nr:cytochrome P450 306a1 [Sitophilus oryzae]XP_030746634.1 cytochrome P450 306a1 [Sitophilus oryzae]XP_030746635.1 cytochrome P450 306a1 [Sitophilus oryzae]XP_030746636.1 cytochrome P450 306a1 [Sitophilus oryzae]XP_030746637.1 cytochrome P450 306a1 [Sitophilus oryzae]